MATCRGLIVLPWLLALAGCSPFLPASYVPSTAGQMWGYAEAPVRRDCMEISFVGRTYFSVSSANEYATYRAAELTLQAGKSWFRILAHHARVGRWLEYIPAETTEVPTTTIEADGSTTTTWETVETAPAYYETRESSVDTILVRMLDAPEAGAIDAGELLRQAKQRGVRLSPLTLTLLAGKHT